MRRLRIAVPAWALAVFLLCTRALFSTAQEQPPGNADRGRVVFEKRCTGCHALDRDREGPHLKGVYGRAAGMAAGFDYSDALKKAHIVWNGETLNRWLTDPDAMVPGNNMEFHVAKPDERIDIIRFLQSQPEK